MTTSDRLDALARDLGRGRSRRALLGDVLGMCLGGLVTLGFVRRSGAQQAGTVALGGACTADEQCAVEGPSVYGPPPICAPSGQEGSAVRICCLGESGACRDDRECCAGLLCTGSQQWGSGPTCQPAVAVPTRDHGESCTSPTQCFQTNGAIAACAGPVGASVADFRCCNLDGSACGTDADCCGGRCGEVGRNICSGGVERIPVTMLAATPLYAEASPTAPVVAILPVGGSGSMLTTHGISGFAQVFGPGGWIGWADPRSLGTLGDLLPQPAGLLGGLSVVEDSSRSAEDVAATFPDPAGTLALLRQWGLAENLFRQFVAPGGVAAEITVAEVSLYACRTEEGADQALRYFAAARSNGLGLVPNHDLFDGGDDTLAIEGERVDGGFEATRYVRQDLLLARVSTIGEPAAATALTGRIVEAILQATE